MSAMLEERTQEREIGGILYKAQPVAFGLGLRSLNRLIKVLAPLIAASLREGRASDRAASLLELLPASLTDDDIDYFRTVFGGASWYMDGEPTNWIPLVKTSGKNAIDHQELHFAGRYPEFLEWLVFCVEVNYGGFFNGVTSEENVAPGVAESKPTAGGIFGTLAAVIRGEKNSPPTRGGGSSGES